MEIAVCYNDIDINRSVCYNYVVLSVRLIISVVVKTYF